MRELYDFISQNGLRQIDVVKYLGLSKPYVSQVCNGKAKLSSEQIGKLINNDRGWDVSMLTAETALRAECPRAVQAPDDAACLRARVSELESALAHERETTRRLLALLEKLSRQ